MEALADKIASQPPAVSLSGALKAGGVRLIAEVKKASPSRGLLRPDFDPVDLARTYSSNGASAISILTDPRFQGELDHIVQVKAASAHLQGQSGSTPVLRKDFIFDPYQVHEARAAGADAILLIVAILTSIQVDGIPPTGPYSLGMDCLVEVHNPDEVQVALDAGAEIIGINNRDLRTFVTDLQVTRNLAPLGPWRQGAGQRERHPRPRRPARPVGFRGQRRPGGRVHRNLQRRRPKSPGVVQRRRSRAHTVPSFPRRRESLESNRMTRVKICGIRALDDAVVAADAGADFIGLVFVPGRRRRLELDPAREIVAGLKGSLETPPKVVGLFADQPLEEVNHIIDACNLDAAQLCGAESLDYCRDSNAQVIKVLHIPQGQASSASTQELSDRIKAHTEQGHYGYP